MFKKTSLLLVVIEFILIHMSYKFNIGLFPIIPLIVTLCGMIIWENKITKDNIFPLKSDNSKSLFFGTIMLITILAFLILCVPVYPFEAEAVLPDEMFLLIVIVAPIVEEIIFRHYMIGRLMNVYGNDYKGMFISIMISSMVFSLGHGYQGLFGVLGALLKGIIFSCLYLYYRKNLAMPTIAHMINNFIAFTFM